MRIVRHRPITRGVTELMYVGDDQAVENATKTVSPIMVGAGLLGLYFALTAKSSTAKLIASGVAIEVAMELHRDGVF
jgi:hypothetical protein